MKILKTILDEIIYCSPNVPPETGGILGGRERVIAYCAFDHGSKLSNGYDTYAPDTKFLNQVIRKWQNEEIVFYGIFHCHFPEASDLSNKDRQYIKQIMCSMPSQIRSLYFPIVLPKEKIFVYRSYRTNNQIYIVSDGIEIVNRL